MKIRKVLISDEALASLIAIPRADDYRKVRRALRSLEVVPFANAPYQPAYEAAMPPTPCRVAYAGHYGIYYTAEPEEGAPVRVLAIEDQRRNPLARFQ